MENKISNSLTIIEGMELQQVQNTMQKISQFQGVIQKTLHQNHDFGVVPGTNKPTLLKPGAEKILMLMGLRSEFDLLDSTRDFEKGFFQYQVKCRLYKDNFLITEGLGACNTKERKYIKQDPFTMDNTILKMAKKRALVDATLLVASLSDVFTQDIEDMDLNGEKPSNTAKVAFDSTATISGAQAKRLYAVSGANAELCKQVIEKHGYKKSEDIKKVDYEKICDDIAKERAKTMAESNGNSYQDTPFEEV